MLVFLIFIGLIGIIILYKTFKYYQERRKWSWFIKLAKEKRLTPKETTYLKHIVVRNKIHSTDEFFGSLFSLNLPSPIKRKMLFED